MTRGRSAPVELPRLCRIGSHQPSLQALSEQEFCESLAAFGWSGGRRSELIRLCSCQLRHLNSHACAVAILERYCRICALAVRKLEQLRAD